MILNACDIEEGVPSPLLDKAANSGESAASCERDLGEVLDWKGRVVAVVGVKLTTDVERIDRRRTVFRIDGGKEEEVIVFVGRVIDCLILG